MMKKALPEQPVAEFLLDVTKTLADIGKDTVVFSVPYDLEDEPIYITYRLTVMQVNTPEEVELLKERAAKEMH